MKAVEHLTMDEIDSAIAANHKILECSKTPATQREALAAIDSLLDSRLDVMRAEPNYKTPTQ